MGTHQYGLCLKIGNTADAHGAVHLLRLLGELRTKRRVFNIMDGFVKTGFRVIHRHSRPACAQVGMVDTAAKYPPITPHPLLGMCLL